MNLNHLIHIYHLKKLKEKKLLIYVNHLYKKNKKNKEMNFKYHKLLKNIQMKVLKNMYKHHHLLK